MAKPHDYVVVGAGLFGSIIAAALRHAGRTVVVLDADRPLSGSKPAACLMRPSWYKGMGKELSDPALALLDRLYGLHTIKFKVGAITVPVHWVDPAKVLQPPDAVATVHSISSAGAYWDVHLMGGQALFARRVVVAAGIWTTTLVRVEGGLKGLTGVAFLWPDRTIQTPFIRPWAPYKQLVAFNRGDGLWAGDGTSVTHWSEARAQAAEDRCRKALGSLPQPVRMVGIRPSSRVKPCYLAEPEVGLWVATGGAKNGTIAAAWAANEIVARSG